MSLTSLKAFSDRAPQAGSPLATGSARIFSGRCRTCGGNIIDLSDDLGRRCLQCGRSADPAPAPGQVGMLGQAMLSPTQR
jgi:hypothetical protein